MKNIKLLLAYDGTHYLGWQKTEMGPSIEGQLEATLQKILQQPVYLQAASRTDAGVHANGQVVNFLLPDSPNLNKLTISLNLLLPKDIRVLSIEEVAPTFHPTLDCKGKEYHYFISLGAIQLPIHRHYAWHLPGKLALGKIEEALPFFIGTHNFRAFCKTKKTHHYDDYRRTIHALDCRMIDEKRLFFTIKGTNFLYRMVRNIVGTLVYIGLGKLSVEELPVIFSSQKRALAGVTAPAHGLFLNEVYFD